MTYSYSHEASQLLKQWANPLLQNSPRPSLILSCLSVPPLHSPVFKQTLICFLSLHITLHFPVFKVDGIIWCVLFFLSGFLTQHNYFDIHTHCVYISTYFFLLLYSNVRIHYNVFMNSPANNQIISRFLALMKNIQIISTFFWLL